MECFTPADGKGRVTRASHAPRIALRWLLSQDEFMSSEGLASFRRSFLSVVWGLSLPFLAPDVLAAVPPSAPALSHDYTYQVWKRQDGLPDDQVRSILQTHDGYLWIATRLGLARFDGTRFVVFNHLNVPAMGEDDCCALLEDAAGNLLFTCAQQVFRMTDRGPVALRPGPQSVSTSAGAL